MNVLVTGGAGYIGSHACKALKEAGFTPVTIDNLSRGNRWSVKYGPFYKADIRDEKKVLSIIKKYSVKAVMHFAAYAYVGESVKDPALYYENNVVGTLALLNTLKKTKVRQFVFSSTCATYGVPESIPIEESTPQKPINPYGHTKLIMEQALKDYAAAYGFKVISLRYFNAAGADPDLEIGEAHLPETHLIPLVIEANLKRKKPVTIMGDDYQTADGTCIRDYVHVSDLAKAHVLALKKIKTAEPGFIAYNLATGVGTSVKEIISAVDSYTGRSTPLQTGPRRPGDPPTLMASGNLARKEFGWHPDFALKEIIATAIEWHKKLGSK